MSINLFENRHAKLIAIKITLPATPSFKQTKQELDMEIRNILVNFDIDASNPDPIAYAVDLAKRHSARLIGMAAAEPSLALMGIDGTAAAGEWYVQERDLIEKNIAAAEQRFRSSVPTEIPASWRGSVEAPNRALTRKARCADLVLVASDPAAPVDYLRRLDIGEFVLAVGRPVLVMGEGAKTLDAKKVVVAWKDCREARRAASDALPFLKAAEEVLAVTVDEGDYRTERAGLDDFVAWLAAHDVNVRGDVLPFEESASATIEAAAKDLGADLIVSGGYGHARLREWLFGGVTRDLLSSGKFSRLLSN